MLILDSNIRKRLAGVVNGMTSDPELREDLMQEAMVHFWQAEHQRPGQEPSWYLQSCSFHLRHVLGAGRSIDSSRRGRMRVVPSPGEDGDGSLDLGRTEDPVLDQVSAREILRLLPPLLSRREQAVLKCLAEGLRPGEIVRRLSLSHPTVNKCRRRIAAIAGRLGLMPATDYANCRLGNGQSHFSLIHSFPPGSVAKSHQRALSRCA